jgi:hypothetical protein
MFKFSVQTKAAHHVTTKDYVAGFACDVIRHFSLYVDEVSARTSIVSVLWGMLV